MDLSTSSGEVVKSVSLSSMHQGRQEKLNVLRLTSSETDFSIPVTITGQLLKEFVEHDLVVI